MQSVQTILNLLLLGSITSLGSIGCAGEFGDTPAGDSNLSLGAGASYSCTAFRYDRSQPLRTSEPIGESLSEYVDAQMRRLDPNPTVAIDGDCNVETFDIVGYPAVYRVCGADSSLRMSSFTRNAYNDLIYRYATERERPSKETLDLDRDGETDKIHYYSYDRSISSIAGCTFDNVSSVLTYDDYAASLTILGGTVTCDSEVESAQWTCVDPAPIEGEKPETTGDAGPGPENLRGSVYSATALELFWDRPEAPADHYKVYRDAVLVVETDGVSFFDSGLLADTEYEYGVEAVDSQGKTSARSAITLKTKP